MHFYHFYHFYHFDHWAVFLYWVWFRFKQGVQNTATNVPKIKHIYMDPYGIWANLLFFWDDMYSDILGVQEKHKEFSNGVFCMFLPRPFDKLDMTPGQSQWPWVTRRTEWNQCALLLEKSVSMVMSGDYKDPGCISQTHKFCLLTFGLFPCQPLIFKASWINFQPWSMSIKVLDLSLTHTQKKGYQNSPPPLPGVLMLQAVPFFKRAHLFLNHVNNHVNGEKMRPIPKQYP